MTNNAIEGVMAKLNRANQQLQAFDRRLADDARDGAYGILTYMDDKEIIVKANLPRPLFIEYAVLAGEIIHQMRSALDHLAHILAPHYIGFPVFTDEKEFCQEWVAKHPGVHSEAIAFIRGEQPFRLKGTRSPPKQLHVLNSLWNRDKHRLLLFTKIRFEEFGLTYRWPDGREREYLTRRPTTIEDRADLKRMRHPPGYNADVEVKPHARFGFYFEKAGLASKEPVLELLRKLLTFSNYVLN